MFTRFRRRPRFPWPSVVRAETAIHVLRGRAQDIAFAFNSQQPVSLVFNLSRFFDSSAVDLVLVKSQCHHNPNRELRSTSLYPLVGLEWHLSIVQPPPLPQRVLHYHPQSSKPVRKIRFWRSKVADGMSVSSIVTVHGLEGDSIETWTHPRSNSLSST